MCSQHHNSNETESLSGLFFADFFVVLTCKIRTNTFWCIFFLYVLTISIIWIRVTFYCILNFAQNFLLTPNLRLTTQHFKFFFISSSVFIVFYCLNRNICFYWIFFNIFFSYNYKFVDNLLLVVWLEVLYLIKKC